MLELRPNCEACDKDLAVDSTEAMICSYECTFCKPCVDSVLHNVCPNCGGGLTPRPIRPATERRDGLSRYIHKPGKVRRRSPYSSAEIKAFTLQHQGIAAKDR